MRPLNPKKLSRDEQIVKAYEMRVDSFSFAYIASKLGVCKTTAFNLVQEGKEKYEKFQEENLNHLRNMRIQQLERLVRSRLEDLKACQAPEFDSGYSEEEEMSELDKLSIIRGFIRDRSYIVVDLLKLYQELSRLQGLYEYDKVDNFIVKKEAGFDFEVSNLSDEDLLSLFNDIQKKK